MSIKARIWWNEQTSSYALNGAYNEAFINALKQFIPSGDRDFDPQTKTWFMKEQYGEFVRTMAQNAFGVSAVSFTSKDVAQQSRTYSRAGSSSHAASLNPTSGGTTEDAVVAMMNLMPYEAMKKAYLIALQTLHPDKPNGDAEKTTKLNDLWSRIEKEFYKR